MRLILLLFIVGYTTTFVYSASVNKYQLLDVIDDGNSENLKIVKKSINETVNNIKDDGNKTIHEINDKLIKNDSVNTTKLIKISDIPENSTKIKIPLEETVRKRRQLFGGVKLSENGGYRLLFGGRSNIFTPLLQGYAQIQQDIYPFVPISLGYGVNIGNPNNKFNVDVNHDFAKGTNLNTTIQIKPFNFLDFYDSYSQLFGKESTGPKFKGRVRYNFGSP